MHWIRCGKIFSIMAGANPVPIVKNCKSVQMGIYLIVELKHSPYIFAIRSSGKEGVTYV
ncbi:hypothetical protein BrE312_0821 [Brenneria sp. EniD312]|nr:hypothetical protein BrE312_0821 [Brenneria sp. EniD312]